MFQTLKNAWSVPDLRVKILFTLLVIIIFRIGSHLPVPFIDVTAMQDTAMAGSGSDFFSYINILTGGAMQYGAFFAMSVTPYINASIIMNLLTVAIPALERLKKEGEEGQKKIAKYTRFATVVLGLVQGTAFFIYLRNQRMLTIGTTDSRWFATLFAGTVIVLCFTAGTALMMWLGEQIDDKGIGNGISILLFAGIISQAPAAVAVLSNMFFEQRQYLATGLIILAFALVIVFIVFMTDGERRISVQYAKRQVGRKMYGGQSSHMPIKVNMSGVLPIIFASSILALPQTFMAFAGPSDPTQAPGLFLRIMAMVGFQSPFYAAIYLALIIAFSYFYVTIQYNPVEMANNLRKNNGTIPGYRPGKPTADFIKKIIGKITLVGALFLGTIAILPIIVGGVFNVPLAIGGTSILIVVGVALDTVKQLESQMLMRHYKGFLD